MSIAPKVAQGNVVDIETGEVIPTPLPVRDEVIHSMLQDLMRKNEAGKISALICVLIDDGGDTSYDYSYPVNMPPALYIGGLAVAQAEILRSVRSVTPSSKDGV